MTDNAPLIIARYDMKVVSVRTKAEVWPSGVFHYREALNAAGEVVYQSAWGPGATGSVNGY